MIDTPNSHACAAPGCKWNVAKTILMCKEHSAMVTPAIRNLLLNAYRMENRGAWLEARRQAIDCVTKTLAELEKAKQAEQAVPEQTTLL